MAGTTESKLEYLIRSKEDVRLAINRMLVPCPEDTPFLEYGPKIKQVDVDLSDATVTSSDLMEGVIAYDSKEQKVVGTIPDIGQLVYEPSDELQEIPYGRTRGGHVKKTDITKLNEYQACLTIANSVDNLDDYSGTSATAGDIRLGKTAYSNGELLVGEMIDTNASLSAEGLTTFTVAAGLRDIIKLDLDPACTSLEKAFQNFVSLKRLPEMNTSNISKFNYMCDGCTSLETIPEYNFSKGTSFQSIFRNCTKLTGHISLDAPNASTLANCFQGCTGIESVNITNTSKCTNFDYAFNGCTNLKTVGKINNSNQSLFSYSYMFQNCANLENVEFTTTPSHTASAASMFSGCKKLTKAPYTISMGSVGTGYGNKLNMFNGCESLTEASINAVSWSSSGYYYGDGSLQSCFSDCTSLEKVTMPAADRLLSSNMSSCFKNCTSLRTISMCILSGSLNQMFQGCTALEEVKTLTVKGSGQNIFQDCIALKDVDITFQTNVNTITYLTYWFYNCTSLDHIPQGIIDNTRKSQFNYTFRGCTGLITLPEDLLKNSNLTALTGAFYDCTGLVNVPQYDFSRFTAVSAWTDMFAGCTSLSDESLNNIMASLMSSGYTGTSNKTLKYIGLSAEQATRCQSLSNWAAFSAAGWTTGY